MEIGFIPGGNFRGGASIPEERWKPVFDFRLSSFYKGVMAINQAKHLIGRFLRDRQRGLRRIFAGFELVFEFFPLQIEMFGSEQMIFFPGAEFFSFELGSGLVGRSGFQQTFFDGTQNVVVRQAAREVTTGPDGAFLPGRPNGSGCGRVSKAASDRPVSGTTFLFVAQGGFADEVFNGEVELIQHLNQRGATASQVRWGGRFGWFGVHGDVRVFSQSNHTTGKPRSGRCEQCGKRG